MPVAEAATAMLGARCQSLQQLLASADKPTLHPRSVHQLRVIARRTTAALKLYRDLLPRRPRKWLTKHLRKLRRKAGAPRDLDVLHAWLRQHDLPVSADWKGDRRKAAESLREFCNDLRQSRQVEQHIKRLFAGMTRPGETESFEAWAARQVPPLVQDFLSHEPENHEVLPDLHEFRRAAKRLRYSLELLSPAFTRGRLEAILPIVEETQTRLGAIHDHSAIGAQLANLLPEAHTPLDLRRITHLMAEEAVELGLDVEAFWIWWDAKSKPLRKLAQPPAAARMRRSISS